MNPLHCLIVVGIGQSWTTLILVGQLTCFFRNKVSHIFYLIHYKFTFVFLQVQGIDSQNSKDFSQVDKCSDKVQLYTKMS